MEKDSQLMTARLPVCTTLITLLLLVILETEAGKAAPEYTGKVFDPTCPTEEAGTRASAATTRARRRAKRNMVIAYTRSEKRQHVEPELPRATSVVGQVALTRVTQAVRIGTAHLIEGPSHERNTNP